MDMGPVQIGIEYKLAKDKREILKVLADLNDCSVAEIKEILIGQGFEIKKYKHEPKSSAEIADYEYQRSLKRKHKDMACNKKEINQTDMIFKRLPEFKEFMFGEMKEYQKEFETEKEAIRYMNRLYQYIWIRYKTNEIIVSKAGRTITVRKVAADE